MRRWLRGFLVISNFIFYEKLCAEAVALIRQEIWYISGSDGRWELQMGGHTSSLQACHIVFYVLNAWFQMMRKIIYFLKHIHIFFFENFILHSKHSSASNPIAHPSSLFHNPSLLPMHSSQWARAVFKVCLFVLGSMKILIYGISR